MAFNTKYRINSTSNVFGGYQINIQKDGYAGSIIELDGVAPNAATLQIGKASNNIFEPVLPSEMEFVWYAMTDFQTLDLANEIDKTWLVLVTDPNGVLIWKGWISPETYQEQYTNTPYSVSVKATDYLNELKAIDFPIEAGLDSLWDFVLRALDETGLSLDFKESINIYDTLMNSTATDSPLLQADAVNISFTAIATIPNCYQALEEILRSFGARIYQFGGHWVIENIQEKRQSYVQRVYNSSGVYQSQSTFNPLVTLSNSTPDFKAFIQKSGAITGIAAVKDAKVFFRTVPSAPNTLISGFAENDKWTNSTTLANWTQVNGIEAFAQLTNRQFDGINNKFVLFLNGRQSSLSDNNYILSQDISIVQSTFEALDLEFYYNVAWPTISILGGKPVFYIQIELEGASTSYYWRNEWVEGTPVNLRIDPSKRKAWNKFQTTISGVPVDGNFRVKIFQLVKSGSEDNTYLMIGGWKLTVSDTEELDPVYEVDIGTTSGVKSLKPHELEVYFADGPVTVRGGVLSVGGVVTSEWSRRGTTDNLSLKRLFLLQFLSLYNRPTLRLQGQLHQRGEQILPINTVRDNPSISDRVYVMNSYTLGLTNGIGAVVYRELIIADANPNFDLRTDPNLLMEVPPFRQFPVVMSDLNGDTSGELGTNTLNPSAIVAKPSLDFTGLISSGIVLNAVPNSLDVETMTKATAKDLFRSWATKATPIGADQITIIDSENSNELKVINLSDLPIDGSKWTDGTYDAGGFGILNGIYRNSYVTIGQGSLATALAKSAKLLVVSDFSSNADASAPAHFQVVTSNGVDVIKANSNQIKFNQKILFTGSNISSISGGLTFTAASGADIEFNTRNLAFNLGNNQFLNLKFGGVTKSSMQYVNATTTLVYNIQNLPTSDPLVLGQVWLNSGVMTVSEG